MVDGKKRGFLERYVTPGNFVLFNFLLFLGMCYWVYWDIYIAYKKNPSVMEFGLYAACIITGIFIIWYLLRGLKVEPWILIMAEVGLVMNFMGGLGVYHGQRVFDTMWLGIRYDKYVHLLNSFAGAVFLARLRWPFDEKNWLSGGLICAICVMGFGSIVEVAEYVAFCNVKGTGVGDYDNNMQDMVWNTIGSLAGVAFVRVPAFMRVRSAKLAAAQPTTTPAEDAPVEPLPGGIDD